MSARSGRMSQTYSYIGIHTLECVLSASVNLALELERIRNLFCEYFILAILI